MGLRAWWKRRQLAGATRMVNEFVERFPGRCPVCSFARYSATHGGPIFKHEPHDCPEKA